MPGYTSNGQVGSRDIRQQAVKTFHVEDDAVTSPKIPDLAITFPDKIDDPFWSAIFEEKVFFNETITTTRTSFATIEVDVPAWVDAVTVMAIGHFQLTNTSGGDVLMSAGLQIDGDILGGGSHEAVNNQTQTMAVSAVKSINNVAGSSFDVDLACLISTGTNTSNNGYIRGLAIGTRG